MVIGFGLTCTSPVPLPGVDPRSITSINYSDGGWRVGVRDIISSQAVVARVLDLVEASRSQVRTFSFSLGGVADNAWQRPDDAWVGAVLLADDAVPLDPLNHFEPTFPAPCYGLVPPEHPLRVLREPSGHIAMAIWETIFSKQLCDQLHSYGDGGVMADVLLDGRRLPGWCRFRPRERMKVVRPDVFRPFKCVGCGTPGTAQIGVWLGRRMSNLTVCSEEHGWDHLNAHHSVLVSVAVAQDLERRLGRGYGLQPIVDEKSAWGRAMAAVLPRVNRLAFATGS